jgi:hypothetical protein
VFRNNIKTNVFFPLIVFIVFTSFYFYLSFHRFSHSFYFLFLSIFSSFWGFFSTIVMDFLKHGFKIVLVLSSKKIESCYQ